MLALRRIDHVPQPFDDYLDWLFPGSTGGRPPVLDGDPHSRVDFLLELSELWRIDGRSIPWVNWSSKLCAVEEIVGFKPFTRESSIY